MLLFIVVLTCTSRPGEQLILSPESDHENRTPGCKFVLAEPPYSSQETAGSIVASFISSLYLICATMRND
jgi:hypothetical protein